MSATSANPTGSSMVDFDMNVVGNDVNPQERSGPSPTMLDPILAFCSATTRPMTPAAESARSQEANRCRAP